MKLLLTLMALFLAVPANSFAAVKYSKKAVIRAVSRMAGLTADMEGSFTNGKGCVVHIRIPRNYSKLSVLVLSENGNYVDGLLIDDATKILSFENDTDWSLRLRVKNRMASDEGGWTEDKTFEISTIEDQPDFTVKLFNNEMGKFLICSLES